MELSRKALSRYDERLSKLEGAAYDYAASRISAYTDRFPGASPAAVRDFAIEKVNEAVLSYGDGAASLAADLYEQMAEAAGAKVRGAALDTSDVSGYIDREVRYQMGKFLAGDLKGFSDACGSKASDQVSRRANQTMRINAKRDGLRFARVPMGGETCTFCAMLASRGFVYRSAKTAGEGNHYHKHCRCKVIPGFDGMGVEGYDPDEWAERWRAFQEIDEGEGTDAEKLAMKRAVLDGKPVKTRADLSADVYQSISPENARRVYDLLDSASGDAKDMYLRFESDFKKPVLTSRGSYYSPAADTVAINERDAFGGRKERGDTWFHEFGHNIDAKLARDGLGSTYSFEWHGGAFPAKIKEEVRAYAVSRKADVQKFAIEQIESGNEYLLADWKLISNRDALLHKMGEMTTEELVSAMKKPSLDHVYRMIGYEIDRMEDADKASLSDLMGGATRNRARDNWGHKTSYWDKDGKALATEAFAEMYAGHISSPRAMEQLRKYLPESCKMFERMLKEANGNAL